MQNQHQGQAVKMLQIAINYILNLKRKISQNRLIILLFSSENDYEVLCVDFCNHFSEEYIF